MRKRLGSVLLALALLVSLAPVPSGSARAPENAETLYIAGKAGAEYGYEEPGYDRGNWVYDEGWTELSSGESVSVGNSYDNSATAAFTRADSGSSTLVLNGYLTWNNAGYENGSNLYGIYYDGNLTIRVFDECQLLAYRSDAFDKVYGICVTGDLTIETIETAKGANLRISMGSDPKMQASLETYGIYCGGTLTINGDEKSGVTTAGGAVTGMNGNSGNVKSCGIYAGEYIQTAGAVRATGGSGAALAENVYPTPATALETFGVCGKNGVTVSGGSLTATGGAIPMSGGTHGGRSVGILAGSLNTATAAPSEVSTLTVSGASTVVKAYGSAVNVSASNGCAAWNRCMSCGAAAHTVTVLGGSLTAVGADLTASGTNNSGSSDSGGESFGIRASEYRQSGGTVVATAGKSDIKPQQKYSDSYGVFTYTYDVSGGTLTAAADQAWRESVGVMVRNELANGGTLATQSGGKVSGTAAVVAGYVTPQTEPCQSTGVWFGYDYQATGGSLNGTGANIGYKRQSAGVLFNGRVSLSGGASVTGTGGDTAKTVGCTLDRFTGNGGGVSSSCGVAFGGTTLTLGEGCTLSGTGGGVAGIQGAGYRVDSIGVWFSNADGATVSGGGTLRGLGGTGARGHGANSGKYYSDDSYGIYAAGTFAASGVAIEARGGDVSTEFVTTGATEPGQYEQGHSYGAYITDAASFTDCAVTASGGNVGYTGAYTEQGGSSTSVGLYGKTLALSGANDMTLTGGAWSENGQERYFSSYGLEFPSGRVTFAHGRLEARGHTAGIFSSGTFETPAYLLGKNFDGSDAVAKKGPTVYAYQLRNGCYTVLDENLVVVTMIGTIYSGYPVRTDLYNAPEGKDPTYRYTGRSGTEYDSTKAPTDVGNYVVEVSFEGSDYYGRTAFAMTPKELTVTGLSAMDKLYDGTAKARLTGTSVLNGVLDADTEQVRLGGTPTASFEDASVGEDKPVTVTGFELTGARAFNYTLAPLSLLASIKPAAISVSGTLTGGTLSGYTVLNAPEGALLIAACYDADGGMLAVKTLSVSGDRSGTLTLAADGAAFCRLMLVSGETYVPLCRLWDSRYIK